MQSIKIGNFTVDTPVLLAPLSGVTDMPFRKLVKSFGAGLVFSEMIASHSIILQKKESFKKAQVSELEDLTAIQLAGCDPHIMAEAARLNEDMGAKIIDINFGCPVKKVVNGHAGSALMKDEKKAEMILKATVDAVDVPVTLKMRLGWDYNSLNAVNIARIAEDVGIKMITVHGRTRCQMFKGTANWHLVKDVKNEVNIPVIVNGDINNFEDINNSLKESGADGVMIGRGVYGKPWFIQQAIDFIRNKDITPEPSMQQRSEVIIRHYHEIIEHYGEKTGVCFSRKHLSWYSVGLPGSSEFRNRVNRELNPNIALNIIKEYFLELAEIKLG